MSVTDESAVPPVEPMVGVTDVEKAHKRIKPFIHRTPLLTSITLDNLASQAIDRRSASRHGQDVTAAQSTATCKGRVHVRLAFKSEHLQRIGAFKMRGATNAVQTHLERLSHDRSSCAPGGRFDPSKLWVVTHSSGNHAAAVACAARSVGARAAVVMPRTAPAVKKAAVAGYGARIVECEPILAERERSAIVLMAELQAADPDNVVRFIHPYDEPLVIAGQGTLGLEMLEQAHELQSDGNPWRARSTEDGPVLDIVVAPVGGGGMLSGVATVVKGRDPQIHVIAAEPKNADDAARSFASGKLEPAVTPPQTICDGLLTALSSRTLRHIQSHVSAILTATEADIIASTQLVWERMKQIIEPSAAVGLAVILNNAEFAEHVHLLAQKKRQQLGVSDVEIRIGVVWSGGNVELPTIVKAIAQNE